ncbi:MAG: V4R domain-containing protein [Chloroflexota bacterium]
MKIQIKKTPDPVAAFHMADAHMRWALQSAEEVVGEKGLKIVLRDANLSYLANNYPPNDLGFTSGITFGDYANLSAELYNFFGRAGKSMTIRIGRLAVERSVEQQAAVFGLSALVAASKLLPMGAQIKAALSVMQNGLGKISKQKGNNRVLRLEDRGNKIAYIDEGCSACAGKTADSHICGIFNGSIAQALFWLTGKTFDVEEVECRAIGAQACVWEIAKEPIS